MAYLAFLESMRGFWLWSARIYSGSAVSAEGMGHAQVRFLFRAPATYT
jgi:hypothetical protein